MSLGDQAALFSNSPREGTPGMAEELCLYDRRGAKYRWLPTPRDAIGGCSAHWK